MSIAEALTHKSLSVGQMLRAPYICNSGKEEIKQSRSFNDQVKKMPVFATHSSPKVKLTITDKQLTTPKSRLNLIRCSSCLTFRVWSVIDFILGILTWPREIQRWLKMTPLKESQSWRWTPTWHMYIIWMTPCILNRIRFQINLLLQADEGKGRNSWSKDWGEVPDSHDSCLDS